MNLEDQVCSFELARELKELGVQQKAAFWWCSFDHQGKSDWRGPYFCRQEPFLTYSGRYTFTFADCGDRIAAFTVAELELMLPTSREPIDGNHTVRYLTCFRTKEGWCCAYISTLVEEGGGDEDVDALQEANTGADARAKMLIYLIKKGIVKP